MNRAATIPNGYQVTHVNIEAPTKKRLSMKQRLDRTMAIGVPTLSAAFLVGWLAELAYTIKTHVWQYWVETINSPTVQKSVMEGTYRHSFTTNIILDSLVGILALLVVIGCAYWAEAWYSMVKRGY